MKLTTCSKTQAKQLPKNEIENFNNPNIIKELEFAILKYSPTKEKFYQTFEEDLIPILHNLL